jgi:hypothetical protein
MGRLIRFDKRGTGGDRCPIGHPESPPHRHDSARGTDDTQRMTTDQRYGMGTYSFFNQGVDIFAAHAYEVPTNSDVQMHDLLTVFLDPTNGKGGILNVVNDTGGSSTVANPDVAVTVVSYP